MSRPRNPNPPRPCKCGCGTLLTKRQTKYASRAHRAKHMQATGALKRWGSLGGTAGAPTKRRRAYQRAAKAVGRPVNTEEARIFLLGYVNGYSAGRKSPRKMPAEAARLLAMRRRGVL